MASFKIISNQASPTNKRFDMEVEIHHFFTKPDTVKLRLLSKEAMTEKDVKEAINILLDTKEVKSDSQFTFQRSHWSIYINPRQKSRKDDSQPA